MTVPVLDIQNLHTQFEARGRAPVRAVDGLDLQVQSGEIVGLVGESGCGKSVTAMSVLRLIAPPGRITRGRILFRGTDVLTMPISSVERMRGAEIAMIFQQPKVSLNPVKRIGTQIAEQFIRHRGMAKAAAWEKAVELLELVELPGAAAKARAWPHELSGGQAQRVMIAIAIALEPALLIADEPTTALDVTVQAQVLDVLRRRCRDTGTALLLVTHDLGVVAQMADRVAVMYAGQIVEEAPVGTLFDSPSHPYTRGLIGAIPVLGAHRELLADIPGTVPHGGVSTGCRFAPRCGERARAGAARCDAQMPMLEARAANVCDEHVVRCWLERDAVAA
jgi:peptide/nickel transport system ATP-binding protein